MQRKIEETTRTVPVPDHSELRIGTLLSIIRQSGLPREHSKRDTGVRIPSLAESGLR